jgi:hypothetical protein
MPRTDRRKVRRTHKAIIADQANTELQAGDDDRDMPGLTAALLDRGVFKDVLRDFTTTFQVASETAANRHYYQQIATLLRTEIHHRIMDPYAYNVTSADIRTGAVTVTHRETGLCSTAACSSRVTENHKIAVGRLQEYLTKLFLNDDGGYTW